MRRLRTELPRVSPQLLVGLAPVGCEIQVLLLEEDGEKKGSARALVSTAFPSFTCLDAGELFGVLEPPPPPPPLALLPL